MKSIAHVLEKYAISATVVVFALFLTFGVVYAANNADHCGLGNPSDDTGTITPGKGRSNDQSWFTNMVCVSLKVGGNR